MNSEIIHELLHSKTPFELQLVSGRTIAVPHQDFIAADEKRTLVVVVLPEGRVEIIRTNQIESVTRVA